MGNDTFTIRADLMKRDRKVYVVLSIIGGAMNMGLAIPYDETFDTTVDGIRDVLREAGKVAKREVSGIVVP